jgi:transcription elongation factor SPT6
MKMIQTKMLMLTVKPNVADGAKSGRDAIGDVVCTNSTLFDMNLVHIIATEEDEEEGLEDDDLELLEENTGASFTKSRLTRLRRGHTSESPPEASSSRRNAIESSDDDLDNDDIPQVQDIQRIWDDERTGDREDEEDLDDFIEYDDDEDGGGMMDETEREEKRKAKRRAEKAKRKAMGARPELAGIDAK